MAYTQPTTRITGFLPGETEWNVMVNNWRTLHGSSGILIHEYGGLELDVSAITKGGLFSASASGVVALLGIGANGTTLEAASGEATGLKWGTGLRFATGTYTGNGAESQEITGIGFAVLFLIISARITSGGVGTSPIFTSAQIIDDNASGGAVEMSSGQFQIDKTTALGADGFTVDDNGADERPNANGETYNYIVAG